MALMAGEALMIDRPGEDVYIFGTLTNRKLINVTFRHGDAFARLGYRRAFTDAC